MKTSSLLLVLAGALTGSSIAAINKEGGIREGVDKTKGTPQQESRKLPVISAVSVEYRKQVKTCDTESGECAWKKADNLRWCINMEDKSAIIHNITSNVIVGEDEDNEEWRLKLPVGGGKVKEHTFCHERTDIGDGTCELVHFSFSPDRVYYLCSSTKVRFGE